MFLFSRVARRGRTNNGMIFCYTINMDNEHDPIEAAAERFAREQRLMDIRTALADIRDGLGHPIDAGITETLVGLKAHGIETDQSCEGHDDRANALPWVDISAPEPDGWREDETLQAQWTKENTAMAEKTRALLVTWQKQREELGQPMDEAHALELHERGIYGAVRLEPQQQERVTALSAAERGRQTPAYRQAMQEFAEYLKERFLAGTDKES